MLINRNPFAREELHRATIHLGSEAPSSATCSWCGNVRHTKSGKPYLYEYGTERDGISASYTARQNHSGLFCCKGCHDSYHS